MLLLRRWKAMQVTATATVVVLGMLVTSSFSLLMREAGMGTNPFDLATLALAALAAYVLVKPLREPKPRWSPPPEIWSE